MIKLEFTLDEVNRLLSLLGRLPFADVQAVIGGIIEQGQPQAEAAEAAQAAQADQATTAE